MASLSTIQAAVDLGTSYYIELVGNLRTNLIRGCNDDCLLQIICLQSCINALQYDVDTEINTDKTTSAYNVLQGIIAGFSGSYNPDPSVVIENTTIVITTGNETLNKTQANLVEDGVGSGNWYLPFLDNDNQPLPEGYTPTYVLYNGVTLSGFSYVASSGRIYSFPSNDPATIQVLVEYIAP